MTKLIEVNYIAEPTPARLHASDAFYRGIRGPVRSGKSVSMCIEIMSRAHRQKPDQRGIRRTKWAVIRNTYRELEDTTLATWKMWFPEEVFGKFNVRTMTHYVRINDVEAEVMFRALDRPDDIKKLLSLELTGAWVNEAKEVPRAIIDVLGDRVEQFPPASQEGCTWGGVLLDTNSPDDDHWWVDLEADPPEVELSNGKMSKWEFFIQPGALIETQGKFVSNPLAENVRNLNGGHDYYLKRLAGKTKSYIRVYYCNQFGFVEEGKRVHPEYVDATHCHPSPIVPDPKHTVYCGLDFGLTPAAVFGQRKSNGQWVFFKELVTERLGVKNFGEIVLIPYILENLLDFDLKLYGDPSETTSQTDESTPIQILRKLGLDIVEAPSQDPTLRREALASVFSRMIDGRPGGVLDPKMKTLRKGLASKFIYKRVKVIGDDKYHNKPDKNFWSHVCEALEYLVLGAGEGDLITKYSPSDDISPLVGRRQQRSPHGWMAG